MTNNYNSNSAGTSIEINAFYDSNMAQLDFKENLQKLKDNLFFFLDYGGETEIELADYEESPCDYIKIETRGYSQGDYAEVIARKNKFTESKEFKDHIHNLFWDHPLVFDIKIDGVEFHSSDFMENEYPDTDEATEKILEYVQKDEDLNEMQKKDFASFFADNPLTPEYS